MKVLLTDYAWTDLDIERQTLAQVGAELIVAPAQDPAALAAAARDVRAIMTNWAKVTREVIDAAPRLQIIARLGIGLDNIDVAHATERKIAVTNVPDYCLIEVAEHALALLLALARKVAFYHLETKQGTYDLAAGPRLARIEGQTLGIVGLGHIGRRLAAKAAGPGTEGNRHEPLGAQGRQRRADCLARRTAPRERLRVAARARYRRDAAPDRRTQLALDETHRLSHQHGPGRPGRSRRAGRGTGRRATGGRRPRRAGSRTAGLVAAAVERPAGDRHAARGVCLARVAREPAHPGRAAGGPVPDRRSSRRTW